MLLLWLLDGALLVIEGLLTLFGDLPVLSLPASPVMVVPIPFIGSANAAILNNWATTAAAVAVALVIGKTMQWLYGLVPFKGT